MERKDYKGIDEVDFYLEDLKSRFDGIDKSKFFLSYSGGKDSHFLYWFIKEYLHDDEILIVSSNTYMEHPEIFQRMKENADIILQPKMKPFEIKKNFGIPCFSKFQDGIINQYQVGKRSESLMQRVYGFESTGDDGKVYQTWFKLNKKARTLLLQGKLHRISPKCCLYLKKKPMDEYGKKTGRKPILGVRGGEGILRKSNYKTCFTKSGKFTPIHDLSDELLEKIYKKYDIELPNVYKYTGRTGCMGCPYGHYKNECEKELALLPKKKREFVIKYFKESYDVLGVNYNEIGGIYDMLDEFEKELK